MQKKTTIFLLILTLSIYASNVNVQITAEENDYRPPSLELTPHESIEIISDDNFTDYGFLGTGTAEDPYIIEGLEIITTEYTGIYIYNTTNYFIIRNCYVDAIYDGIYIDNVADGTATVSNNTCSNNVHDGIKLDSSINSTISNNICGNNDYGGINLYRSDHSIISNNTCSNNNHYGIRLPHSGNSTISNNTFTNCGLYIYEYTIDAYLSYVIENNWVNGKKLGFYTNLESTIIAEPVYGQLIFINCTNVTVRDQILNNATTGLFLYSCTYSTIIDNTCNNGDVGIFLDNSVSSTVFNNTCNNNNDTGIFLYTSSSSTVSDNTCNNNYRGILLYYSDSSTISNNTCNNNLVGLLLSTSISSTVSSNTCINNHRGLSLSTSVNSTVFNNTCSNNERGGIWFYHTSRSTVSNNTCINNNFEGISLSSSDFCVATYNLLQENEGYGIYIESSSDNNHIHHNTFLDNNLVGTSQAYDDGNNNIWCDVITNEGNFWSDWSGTGYYYIDGSAGAFDLYPLDEVFEHTTTEHTSIESTTDENPSNFTLTLLILVVPLLLTRIISKKTKKK